MRPRWRLVNSWMRYFMAEKELVLLLVLYLLLKKTRFNDLQIYYYKLRTKKFSTTGKSQTSDIRRRFHCFLIGPGRFFSRKTQGRGAGGLGFLACSRLSRRSPVCQRAASRSAIHVLSIENARTALLYSRQWATQATKCSFCRRWLKIADLQVAMLQRRAMAP